MTIYDRNLKPGTQLVARYHKQSYTCDVVEKEGKLSYRLADGREFKSPSAAGMAITGHACDGWVFWSVQKEEDNAPEINVEVVKETTPPAPEPVVTKANIFRTPNQRGVPEGQIRWYCHECKQSFLAKANDTPQSCPQGHQAF